MRLFPRENYLKKIRGFYHDDGIVKVITGVRRCGKSCLMQCIAEELRAEGVDDENIVFFDLVFLIAFIFRKSRDKSFGFHDDCFAS